jgi:mycothiol synthase
MDVPIDPCGFHKHPVAVLRQAMPMEAVGKAKFAKQVLLDPNFRPEGSLLAKVDGEPAGYILALARQTPLENAPDDSDRGYITLFGVAPWFRRRGVGGALLEAAEDFLRYQGRQEVWISPYAPGYFAPGVDVEAYAEGLAFLAKRGYQEVYRPISMEVPLWSFAVPDWVQNREANHRLEGVAYTPFTPALIRPLIEFAERVFQGDWVRVCRQTALRILDGDNPQRLQIALDNRNPIPQVLGFSHFDGERFGPIGVDPEQRGRGIGQVLMYRTLQAQRDAGLRTAWFLWSDDKTAERLYDAAGFKIVRRFALLKKEL